MYDGWRQVEGFPGYAVSENGEVQNLKSGRIMTKRMNNNGIVRVGLIRDGAQYNRSVTLLVAKAFLNAPPPAFRQYNTPICLDGDRSNNYYKNLLWRPRYHAMYYHNQFKPGVQPAGCRFPIVDVDTGEEYETSWPAAIRYGFLDASIFVGVVHREVVDPIWPEQKLFKRLKRRFGYDGEELPYRS